MASSSLMFFGSSNFSRMASSSLMFFGSSNFSGSALGILANASLDGANTVNGPLPSRAVTSLPAVRAVTSVERSLTLSASWTMFLVGAAARKWWGISTWSMMCTTPLVASLSAEVTRDSRLTYTWPSEVFSTSISEPSRVLNLWSRLRSLACTAAPDTTWYSRMASSVLMFFGSSNFSSSALGILANASLDGANTVKGPLPSRAVTSLLAVRAVTSVERSLTLSASWTMFLVGPGGVGGFGMSTPSMMCTTPLLASLSAEVTCDCLLI